MQQDGQVIQRASLPAQVQEILRKEIVTGVWAPGSRLPEIALCDRFGVSRTPLREALKALESEGLLNLYPSRGAIVSDVTIADIEDKMRVLRALEALAVEIACEVASDGEIEEIVGLHTLLLKTFERSKRGNDIRDFYSGNFSFHQALVEASHNATLIDMHRHLHRHVQRVRHLVGLINDSADGMEGHERIVAAIKARNSEAAKLEMAGHMGIVKDRLMSAMRDRWADKPRSAGESAEA